jgi:hypothetical protein
MHEEIEVEREVFSVAPTANKPMTSEAHKQIYDNVCKRLIEGQARDIIALLFPDLQVIDVEELTIEVLLPPRRMDKVHLITTSKCSAILHLEIEVSPNGRGPMSRRMLVYHSLLLEKYNKNDEDIPVLTYVLYPFEKPSGEPTISEAFEDQELLRFHHREILLKTLDARHFVQEHAVPLYGLLPAMDGLSEELLKQAVEDMLQYYQSRGENEHLRDELLCFQTLLQRARRLPEVQIERVLRRIRMYDPLLEEDPWVQGYGEKREARGKTEATRQNIALIVQARFPRLEDLAMERVERIADLEALQKVLVALSAAPDERSARRYLLALQEDTVSNS